MPLPEYTWMPDLTVVPIFGGGLRVTWNHIEIDNPIGASFEPFFSAGVSRFPAPHSSFAPAGSHTITGQTPEDVPMVPEDIRTSEWTDSNANSIHRWAGLGLFAYEVYINDVLVGRTHMSSVHGLVETALEVYSGGTDSLGNPITTTHSYAMEPYIRPNNTFDVDPGDVPSGEADVSITALYEEIPPNDTWVFTGTHCLHYSYDIVWNGTEWVCTPIGEQACQESVVPSIIHGNDAFPAGYPNGATNAYLFQTNDCIGSHAHGNCPCTIATCQVITVCPQPLLGIYTGDTEITSDYGVRYRIPGVNTVVGPTWVLDGARELVWEA